MRTSYEPLEVYLARKAATRKNISLSFREVESIIRMSLPASAYKYRAWWANQKESSSRPQARAWLNAGYKVDSVQQNPKSGSVVFKRA